MEKPTIFIGSSSEQLPIAKAISEHFQSKLECTVWTEGVFRLGESTLTSLLRGVRAFDFALIIFAGDDYLEKRGEAQFVPRDNVLFELGLFMGAAGPKKALPVFIKEGTSTVKAPSDLSGINVLFLDELENGMLSDEAKTGLNHLGEQILQEYHHGADYQILPSTGIAVGYYHNFLEPVCRLLAQSEEVFSADDQNRSIPYDDFVFEIYLPSTLRDANVEGAQHHMKKRDFQRVLLSNPNGHRSFPFFTQARAESAELIFSDFPTTLRSSDEAVDLILGSSSLRDDMLRPVFDRKELGNFEKTLRLLIKNERGAVAFRDKVRFVSV